MNIISFVLPCYNEKDIAIRNIRRLQESLQKKGWNFEILVCDDASNDGTSELLDKLNDPQICVIHYTNGPSRRENVGLTLKKGKGEILAFMDIDLSTSLESLDQLIRPVQSGEYDLAIGSRYQKGAVIQRDLPRLTYSKLYNRVIRILLKSRIRDHQCGFKAFRRDVFLKLLEEMGYDKEFSRGWFWDAELLIRAQRNNMKILEFPVHWVNAEKSSFHFLRELKVIPYMIRLWARLK